MTFDVAVSVTVSPPVDHSFWFIAYATIAFCMPEMLGGKLPLSASMEKLISLASKCCWMRSA